MIKQPKKQLTSHSDERYYYTPHFYLAAYVYAHGMELVNVDRDSLGKPIFVFRDRTEREELVHEFKYGPEALVDARKFTLAISDLRERVKQLSSKGTSSFSL